MFEAVFIVIIVYLALTTSIKMEGFRTSSVVALAFLLTLSSVVGGVIYLITVMIEASVNTSYGILSFLLTSVVYLCAILIFIPPVLSHISKNIKPFHRSKSSRSTVWNMVGAINGDKRHQCQ